MSVEWFDLAQRLYAAETGRPVARLAHTTFTPSASALAVRASARGGSVSVSAAAFGGGEETACDEAGLALLARLGGTLAADAPAMLLTDDGGTIPALVGLARAHAHHSDPNISGSAAMVGWWADRADHPGTSAVVNLPAASSARYVLGVVPEAQRSARVWRTWFQITGRECRRDARMGACDRQWPVAAAARCDRRRRRVFVFSGTVRTGGRPRLVTSRQHGQRRDGSAKSL